MPQSEATKKWCDEARRLVKLAASERVAGEKALEKAQVDRHKELTDRFAALTSMVDLNPTLVQQLDHELTLARSMIHVGNFGPAAEALQAFDEQLAATAATHKANARAAVQKASRIAEEERQSLKHFMADQLAQAGGGQPSDAALKEMRRLADLEFKRDATQADLLKQAGALQLDLPPPPARTAFVDNATEAARLWTEDICRLAFQTYTWFQFKDFRKQAPNARIKVGALTQEQSQITDDVMWRLYQYRRHVVDELVATLNRTYPGQLLFSSNGSEDIESDLDITVASPNSGVDVEAMSWFNTQIKSRFGRPPGRVFDTNLYARDYNAIKSDNLSKKDGDAPPVPADHAIAEPGGEMQKMANIDQDVATLMKQRRFMDADAFEDMWLELCNSMPVEQQATVRQRFEEAEDAYLMTSLEKIDAIEKQVSQAIAAFDDAKYAAVYGEDAAAAKRQAIEGFHALAQRMADARAAASGPDSTQALKVLQRLQDEYLDFMEQNFEDETMEATDALYAKRMADLRNDQLLIQARELSLAGASNLSAKDRAKIEVELASAKARAKQAQFTNIVFANEAYVSQGAITHVVSGKQAGDASVLAAIPPAALVQSSNEQLADFLKDMKHMEHGAAEAEGDTKRRQANGEAFVHASKYLARMLEAVAMLEDKYTNQLSGKGEDAEKQLRALKEPTYPLVSAAGATSPKALQTIVEGHLLKLRKSSTVPGDVKAELAVAESLKLFGAGDIATLRAKIQAFCTEFNRRVRSMADFQQSQAADETAFRQYFDPAYEPPRS